MSLFERKISCTVFGFLVGNVLVDVQMATFDIWMKNTMNDCLQLKRLLTIVNVMGVMCDANGRKKVVGSF